MRSVVVKHALGARAAALLHPDEACDRIEQEVPEALADRGSVQPLRFDGPVVERVREMAEMPELRRLLGRETQPGPEVSGRQAIERFLDHAAVHYYHPVGSCKMGPASDPDSPQALSSACHGVISSCPEPWSRERAEVVISWSDRSPSRRGFSEPHAADQRIRAARRSPWPPPSATRPCASATRNPQTGERLATDGPDRSGYADRPPTRLPCPADPAPPPGSAPPGVMTRQDNSCGRPGPCRLMTRHGRLRHH